MLLITAATSHEMEPFLAACRDGRFPHLITGIGPLETAVRLSARLQEQGKGVTGVINFGVAGAYQHPGGDGPGLLDICLAEREVLGDLGICLQDRIERFSGSELAVPDTFVMDPALLERAMDILDAEGVSFYSGTFVTVSCATGTAERGAMLAGQHRGLCENMEGAAVARVCLAFALPCLEIRCISNMVEDRDTGRWQLRKACASAAGVTAAIVRRLAAGAEVKPGAGK
jgi:futalosine hydrolase